MIVGRAGEVASLVSALNHGGMGVASGPAGIGKTAVLHAAAAETAGPVLSGGGLATLSWAPYLPLARALGRRHFRGDRASVIFEVAQAVGGGVVVIDDLHYCDQETLDVIPELATRVRLLAGLRMGGDSSPAAIEACLAAGADIVELSRLDADDAAKLVRELDPALPAHRVADIVGRAGGNPLVVTELVVTGEPSPHLRTILTARVRQLAPAAQYGLAMLGLVGHPAPADWIDGAADLRRAGALYDMDDGTVAPAHELLASTAVDLVGGDDRRRLHSRIAQLISSDAEAARHHQCAGEHAKAVERALRAAEAATGPGELARHLGIAAASATGRESDALRLRAARALVEAGDYAGADRLAAQVTAEEPMIAAEGLEVGAEAAYFQGNFDRARALVEKGLDLARSTDSPVEVRLRIVESRFPVRVDWDVERALDLTNAAWELARRVGVEEAKARSLLGSAHLIAGDPAWMEHFEAARRLAIDSGDIDTEAVVTNSLIAARFLNKEAAEGDRVAREGIGRVRELGLRGWELQFRAGLVGITALCLSQYSEALDEALWLSEQSEIVRTRRNNLALGAYCSACLGRHLQADALLAAARDTPGDQTAVAISLMAEMELRWWRRDLAGVIAAADASLALGLAQFPTTAHAVLLAAWAHHEQGQPIEVSDPNPSFRIAQGVLPELRALRALQAGDHGGAAEGFAEAADAWRGAITTCALRCRIAEANARAASGDRAEAVRVLGEVEDEAGELGIDLVRARLKSALRAAGVRGAARSSSTRGLTMRELEVLGLVADGLSTDDISIRLSTAPSTVEAQIASAMRKLGASTRLEAAALRLQATEVRPRIPLIVAEDAVTFGGTIQLLEVAGWSIVRGFGELGEAPISRPTVCAADVASSDDVPAAVVAALAGAGVIAMATDVEVRALLVDDLGRIGRVEVWDRAAAPKAVRLEREGLHLLRLIADGASVTAAADALHVSRRTAVRRLEYARLALGVATNAEASIVVGAELGALAPGRRDR